MEIINAEALVQKGIAIGRKQVFAEEAKYLRRLEEWFKETEGKINALNKKIIENDKENQEDTN